MLLLCSHFCYFIILVFKEMQSKTLEAPQSGQKERSRNHNPCMSISFGGFFFSLLTLSLEPKSLLLKSLIENLLISDDKTPADINVSKN